MDPWQPVALCSDMHGSIDIEISDAHFSIAKTDTNETLSFYINLNENKYEQVFQAADLNLNVNNLSNKNLAEKCLNFLSLQL